MTNALRHFEVEAENVERAKRFYESVFGWKCSPWGPPDYYLIETGEARVSGDIRAGSSVTEAGLEAGYQSTSAFVAAFRSELGYTPARMRSNRNENL